MTSTSIHIGQILKNHIKLKRITKAALARKLGRHPSRILEYEYNASLQLSILIEISHALKHNFFADIAALLPDSYTVTSAPNTAKDERITALERELEILKAEKEVLLKAMGRG